MRTILSILCFTFFYSVAAQDNVAKFDTILTAYNKDKQFNGVVLIAKDGKVLFNKGYGFSNIEANRLHDGRGIFMIGSITKPFTSAVIMQLQEEGKLSVKDPLSKYFDGFENGDQISIEHMLSHTSGIHNFLADSNFMSLDLSKPISADQLINTFRAYKSDFKPGTAWNYSNTAYCMLGYIIQKIEGKPYEQVVRERIFNPLGMINSGFDYKNLNSPLKTNGYSSVTDWSVLPILDSTIAYSAGAIYSTAEDLLKWERGLSSGKLFNQNSAKSVFTPKKNSYGYGWIIDTMFNNLYYSHNGGTIGYVSEFTRFPDMGLVIILLDNASNYSLGKIKNTLAAAVFNQDYVLPGQEKIISLTEDELRTFVGEYQFSSSFVMTVELVANQLKVKAGGSPLFEIYPEKENLFFLKAMDAKLEFVKDDEGKVTSLILNQGGKEQSGKKIK